MATDHLKSVRTFELDRIREWLPPPLAAGNVLELGAGTGHQATLLRNLGYRVTAVDLPDSDYAAERVCQVVDYDGRSLPFADGEVDVLYSSNVLEHVPHIASILVETKRVLSPVGLAIHVLPTPSWRLWTTLAHYPWVAKRAVTYACRALRGGAADRRAEGRWPSGRRLLNDLWPTRHGERGNVLTEAWYFSETWWRQTFRRAGFHVVHTEPIRLYYTGAELLAGRISITTRSHLSGLLGSACRIFVLRVASGVSQEDLHNP